MQGPWSGIAAIKGFEPVTCGSVFSLEFQGQIIALLPVAQWLERCFANLADQVRSWRPTITIQSWFTCLFAFFIFLGQYKFRTLGKHGERENNSVNITYAKGGPHIPIAHTLRFFSKPPKNLTPTFFFKVLVWSKNYIYFLEGEFPRIAHALNSDQ